MSFFYRVSKCFILFTVIILRINASCIHNIDFYPINSIKRDDYLKDIEKNINKAGFVFLYGLGGIGKSRLANSFVIRLLDSGSNNKYKAIWWIDGKKNIITQLNQLIKSINENAGCRVLEESGVDECALLRKIENHFKKRKIKALIIFDSVENFKLAKLILESSNKKNINFLITARHNFSYAPAIKITPFTRNESIAYLKKIIPNFTDEEFIELAKSLNDYPLSLSQSAHFIQQSKIITIREYISLYEKNIQILWKKEGKLLEVNEGRNESVYATIRVLLSEVSARGKLPEQLLIIFSLLNSRGIPSDLIYEIAYILGWKKENVEDAITLLINFDIIDVRKHDQNDEIVFDIHEIVQRVVLLDSKTHEIEKISQKLADFFQQHLIKNKNTLITLSEKNHQFIAHAFQFIKNIKEYRCLAHEYAVISICLLDYLLYVKRDHQTSLEVIDELFPTISLIKDRNISARFYSSAGDVLSLHRIDSGRLKQVVYEINLLLKDTRLKDPYERVRLQNTITQKLLLQSKPHDAANYILESLKDIKSFKNPENKIPTFYFVGWFYIEMTEFEKALSYLNESISLFDKIPDTAIKFYTYNFKSFALLRLKKYKDALASSIISINKCSSFFGVHPSDTLAEALTYNAEANLLVNGSKSALPIIDKALDAYNSFYKGSDKVLDQAYSNMIKGDCYLFDNKIKQALSFYVKALSVCEKIYASKQSLFFKRLIVRLIYSSHKLNLNNISKRYSEICKNHQVRGVNIEQLKTISSYDLLNKF